MTKSLAHTLPEPFAAEAEPGFGFSVGGVSVRVTTSESAGIPSIPSLMPFSTDVDLPDIHLRIARVPQLSPTRARQLFDSGALWRLYEDRAGFQFDFTAAIFGARPYKRLLVDRRFRQATLQMSDECSTHAAGAPQPLGYPLDELLITHRLTQESAIELHGVGIVGPNGASNLFIGHSGAGKSTTARLWTSLHPVQILSD